MSSAAAPDRSPDRKAGPRSSRRSWLAGLTALAAGCAAPRRDTEVAPGRNRRLPLPGESFLFRGREAFVIAPPAPSGDRIPWVWYAPTLPGLPGPEEAWLFGRLQAAGIGVAGVDVGESFGSPAGVELYDAFHRHVIRVRRWRRRPCLLARSRGGLMLLNWAVGHPREVGAIAGIYPVCDPSSYPGLDRAAPAYGLSPEAMAAELARHNPLDRLAGLARARVPVFLLHGDSDTVVPLERNSGELARRYRALGGPVRLEVPTGQGHSMWPGFFQSEPMAAFIVEALTATAGP